MFGKGVPGTSVLEVPALPPLGLPPSLGLGAFVSGAVDPGAAVPGVMVAGGEVA